MAFFDLFDSVNTYSVSAACELFLEECVDHTEGNTKTDYALTKCKYLGIVMLSAHLRHEFIGAESASDPLVFIADKRDTDTGAADRDASFRLPA